MVPCSPGIHSSPLGSRSAGRPVLSCERPEGTPRVFPAVRTARHPNDNRPTDQLTSGRDETHPTSGRGTAAGEREREPPLLGLLHPPSTRCHPSATGRGSHGPRLSRCDSTHDRCPFVPFSRRVVISTLTEPFT
ncbi:hypothetical protein B005_3315 [Nocardiopsis alba ATCC BAA-2165]|uniref:Uncharacterized protein n=1 Tax=Nocardiopsis alba (strain ATCC BAA-2165 / BE74) TaxID=1205910 RepID=J7L396_NOCAA|nr:hypothetical protein B005_3315 [Nocardiopsis alba ATCC BAA-2165]